MTGALPFSAVVSVPSVLLKELGLAFHFSHDLGLESFVVASVGLFFGTGPDQTRPYTGIDVKGDRPFRPLRGGLSWGFGRGGTTDNREQRC